MHQKCPKENRLQDLNFEIFLQMCVTVTKVGQGHPKLLLVQRLYRAYQAAKHEVDR